MINFLHTNHPTSILISLGPIAIHYYGLFIMLGALTAIVVGLVIAKHQQIKQELIIDLAFWLLICGIIGARLYHVFMEFPFYLNQPLNIFKIWNGGMAIHGGIIAGVLVIYWFSKKHKLNFWQLSSIVAISLPLAQAIGRWGNYFNQELFGKPTSLPWGIHIDQINRPWRYLDYDYFHPAFLYESLGNLIIFVILIFLYFILSKKPITNHQSPITNYQLLVTSYALLYPTLRFFMEFIRIDATPILFNLRFPQFVSLLIFLTTIGYLIYNCCGSLKTSPLSVHPKCHH